jgi:hypothetical protein
VVPDLVATLSKLQVAEKEKNQLPGLLAPMNSASSKGKSKHCAAHPPSQEEGRVRAASAR